MTTQRRPPLDRPFYLGMALLIAAIVIYGFSRTVTGSLLHPDFPRPPILYVHAVAYMAWVLLFVVQTALIAARRRRRHRWLGWGAVGVGCAIPPLGIATALAMTRIRSGFGDSDDVAFLAVAFYDMAAFTVLFALGVWWRKSTEIHQRLMLIASIGLCVAALTRFPTSIVPTNFGYVFVDALIAAGAVRDLVVIKRIHPVYLVALPLLIAFQAGANALYLIQPIPYLNLAYFLIGG